MIDFSIFPLAVRGNQHHAVVMKMAMVILFLLAGCASDGEFFAVCEGVETRYEKGVGTRWVARFPELNKADLANLEFTGHERIIGDELGGCLDVAPHRCDAEASGPADVAFEDGVVVAQCGTSWTGDDPTTSWGIRWSYVTAY